MHLVSELSCILYVHALQAEGAFMHCGTTKSLPALQWE